MILSYDFKKRIVSNELRKKDVFGAVDTTSSRRLKVCRKVIDIRSAPLKNTENPYKDRAPHGPAARAFIERGAARRRSETPVMWTSVRACRALPFGRRRRINFALERNA
ncbi:hypothetical protein EVAR_49097_1 [Eumeta japonica]|uniref:Uncharacterized protein n=1 Tax=Eumeta variegata TaxID=151549 RepID=A0A4C1ZRF7_EUMVA|nr:hypothetical protein EVAR_49097_1 [Eumeta japonica]